MRVLVILSLNTNFILRKRRSPKLCPQLHGIAVHTFARGRAIYGRGVVVLLPSKDFRSFCHLSIAVVSAEGDLDFFDTAKNGEWNAR